MKYSVPLKTAFLFLLLGVFLSLKINAEPKKTIIIDVAPNTVDCEGPFPMKCLIVNGELFYGDIRGYTHKAGVASKLKVEEEKVCNSNVINDCPQDVSAYVYRLIEVIDE